MLWHIAHDTILCDEEQIVQYELKMNFHIKVQKFIGERINLRFIGETLEC